MDNYIKINIQLLRNYMPSDYFKYPLNDWAKESFLPELNKKLRLT